MSKRDKSNETVKKRVAAGLAALRKELEGWMPQPRARGVVCPYCGSQVLIEAHHVPPQECPVCGERWKEEG